MGSFGRFVLLRPLVAGGVGMVGVAYDPSLRTEVAITVVDRRDDARARARLMKEAQAMAAVKHPNVVSVLEVGELAEGVYMTMEPVDGSDLLRWSGDEHTLRERLSAIVQAGEGLAAAHASDLVHGDFKPQNCIIDETGRVRVLDFGLARALADRSTLGAGGTLRYMAPEQAAGEVADARSDQFSFGVSAFEILTQRHPFGGDAGLCDPSDGIAWRDDDLPAHVRAVLTRALHPDPAERFESMAALLESLRVDPSASRWVLGLVAVAAGFAVVGVAVGFSIAAEDPSESCDTDRLDAAWNPARRGAAEAAFDAAALPHAEAAWAGVAPTVDAYADQLRAQRISICDAPAAAPQAIRALALRRGCLDERTRELEAAAELFERADADVLRNWTGMLDSLGNLARCEDVPSLLVTEVAPPPPEHQRAVSAVLSELARGRALRQAGKLEDAQRVSAEALEAARATEHGPTVARALINLADSHRFARNGTEAEPLLGEAFAVAMRFDDRESVFEAADGMVRISGELELDPGAVAVWSTVAEAALDRLGNPPRLRLRWLTTQGAVGLGTQNPRTPSLDRLED